ncbi:MAG: hypothetical protein JXB05_20110 [Myxococcaceae bacterium]|nr:hypothetical protein [Myxococcaceae bacterium]
MTERHRASFIRYELPEPGAGEPPKSESLDEQAGKGKPRPVTTLAVGEESGGPRPRGAGLSSR